MPATQPGPSLEQAYDQFLGRQIDEVEAQIASAWGGPIRVERPDGLYTADYDTARLRILVDGAGVIDEIMIG